MGNYRDFVGMLSGWGIKPQSQRPLCVSLQIVRHHVFVLLVGLSVFANSGPKAANMCDIGAITYFLFVKVDNQFYA